MDGMNFLGTPTKPQRGRQKLSEVGERGAAGLGCPRCGGTQFKARRSKKGLVAVGLLAPKTQVQCVACGAKFKRG